MGHGKRILELIDELQIHPGTEAYRRLESLSWSLYTFGGNMREVLSVLNYLTENPASWDLQALRRRDQLKLAEREVARRLHNAVAAAFSLVEHTRVLRRHIHEDPEDVLFRDPAADEPIQERIEQEFTKDPATKFLQDLRRFVQHRELPSLVFQMAQPSPDEAVQRRILLSTAQLLEWDGWSAPSKQFLRSTGEYVDLREVLSAYEARVDAFYEAFERHYRGLYQLDLERRRQLLWEFGLLEIEDAVATHPSITASGQLGSREEAFASVFLTAQYAEIEAVPDGPSRGEAVLSILERLGEVPDTLKAMIRQFYTEPEQGQRPPVPPPPDAIAPVASDLAFMFDPSSGLLVPASPGPPELGAPQTIRDQRVSLFELVDQTAGDYLDRITFERCEIVGPAIVVPMYTEFIDCTWDDLGTGARDLFWELSGERKGFIGAIALRECRFVHCSLEGIGVAGTAAYLATWHKVAQFPKIE